jgi:hypothetical protein
MIYLLYLAILIFLLILFSISACIAGGSYDDNLQRAIIRDLAAKRGGDGYFVDGKCAGIDAGLCPGCCVKPCVMFDQSLPENQPI